jgi:uncharacterized protein (DUF488 family)
MKDNAAMTVYTIGHSTRSLDEFEAMLAGHGIACLADVRTVPRSRRNPQFNREKLGDELQQAGIRYVPMPGLGGFRKTGPQSPNMGWHNESFRGYADYMQTSEFAAHLGELMALAERERVAIMCAEAVPWRCHRSLLADALLIRGVKVEEIVDAKRTQPHALTSFARVEGTRLTYPPPSLDLWPPAEEST